MVMKRMGLALALVALAGCAGRDAQPVAVVQAHDDGMTCQQIEGEIAANSQKIAQLQAEKSGKLAQNVAAGIGGLFLFPIWFAMDFKGAAATDEQALNSRQVQLGGLAREEGC
ncbi:MAG: hypothetical protein RJA36_1411 [Pseudomonadota bacterium]